MFFCVYCNIKFRIRKIPEDDILHGFFYRYFYSLFANEYLIIKQFESIVS